MRFKQVSILDIQNIIDDSINESSEIDTADIAESINVTFNIIDKKLEDFFNE